MHYNKALVSEMFVNSTYYYIKKSWKEMPADVKSGDGILREP